MIDRDPWMSGRRVFIKGLGVVSAGFVLSTMLGGCETLLEQIKNRPVRRRLRTGSPEVDQAIAVYKDAVSLMKARPASDPRSWSAQAAIHGTVGGGFNFCEHGSAHFFSWHRAYLLYFERICQTLTGVKSFGLPYWNWNQNPAMHPAFTDPSSPLNHPRNNTTVAGDPAFGNATMNTIFADSNFLTFSSQLEGSPHNLAHVIVGGDMVTGGSPLDPVFWTHHCMADYCWAKWNIELGNDNPSDPAWNGTSWSHFVDGMGNPASATAGTTVLMPLLSYRYETSAVGGFSVLFDLDLLSMLELQRLEARLRKGADVRFDIKRRYPLAKGISVPIDRPSSLRAAVTADELATLLATDERAERILLRIAYADAPPTNDFFVRVFVGLPDANAQTPTESPHYAGSFAFFGTAGGGHGTHHRPKTDFVVNATPALQRIRQRGMLRAGDPLTVQLVAVPVGQTFVRPGTELVLGDVELVVSPVAVRPR